ncbi:hypothetical protein Vadar_002509 [Vaccinium darrowii]|uniref:Uncharacterized protein n=1 Tax=Vaccinium darrowii TaxID=229202 RepID=A0ACB7X764_9ERIC|nr:hypothetical protein Vadar_002509 [Vaccinium darrowii]
MGFSEGRNIHVNSINSLKAMVLKVVFLKGDRHWYTNGEVSKNPKASVIEWSREGEVVTQLMNGQEEVVVEKRAEKVGYNQYFQPACIMEESSSPQLKQNDDSNLQ